MTSKQTIKFAKLQLAAWNGKAYWFTFNQKAESSTCRAGAVLVRKES
jgi:hypothetical protein